MANDFTSEIIIQQAKEFMTAASVIVSSEPPSLRETGDMSKPERPLSPFMLGQYYRFQMTSVSSLLTRISGNALIGGAVIVVAWLLALVVGGGFFDCVHWLITSWLGRLALIACLWAIWYHTLAGIRHLLFDRGIGLRIDIAEKLGWACIIGSFVLTALSILLFVIF